MDKQVIIGEEGRIYIIEDCGAFRIQLEIFSSSDGKLISKFGFCPGNSNDLIKFKNLLHIAGISVGSYVSMKVSNGDFYFLHHFRNGVYKLIYTTVNFTPTKSFGIILRPTEIVEIVKYLNRIV